jgi:hypothetical protein
MSTAATQGASGSNTVTPVAKRSLCALPTLRPATSVMRLRGPDVTVADMQIPFADQFAGKPNRAVSEVNCSLAKGKVRYRHRKLNPGRSMHRLATLFALLMMLSLAACGQDTAPRLKQAMVATANVHASEAAARCCARAAVQPMRRWPRNWC